MRQLRLLIIAIATICVLAIGAFALVNQIMPAGGDDIIIKGGSLEIQCGANQGTDCLGTNDNTGKYKAKQATKHVTRVVVKDSSGVQVFDSSALPTFGSKPEIRITYK
ncbi:MAG TPA: hypothetical protein VHR36_16150 [Pyrinomonadaceae bacterium]|jgi:hypothetical protein|nr:hypothetical protein [Pyrinomonadaceae bacterium]